MCFQACRGPIVGMRDHPHFYGWMPLTGVALLASPCYCARSLQSLCVLLVTASCSSTRQSSTCIHVADLQATTMIMAVRIGTADMTYVVGWC